LPMGKVSYAGRSVGAYVIVTRFRINRSAPMV